MSTDDILDAIDHALRDVSLSADAMRWTPDAVPEDAKDPSGRHATDVLVGREERPAVDAWDAHERDEAGARYRAALAADPELREEPLSDPHRFARSIGCSCFDTLADVCPRHPGGSDPGLRALGEPQRLTEEYIARVFNVPPDIVRRTLTHVGESALAEHVERARGRQERPGWRVNREATEHVRTRQERVSGHMEGASTTFSVMDEIRRWSNDPRSPIARRGHDFTVGQRRCPGCKAIRDANARITSYGPDAQDLVDRHTHWHREHAYAEDAMGRYRIPLRGDDPLPYYRALWRNAQLHGDRMPHDVPHCRLSAAERGMRPYLLLGGRSPWDGSVMYLAEAIHTINVADTTPEPLSFPFDESPVSMTIPTDTYTAHRFRYGWRGNSHTEVVYLSGVTEQYMLPIVSEAIHRGLIGPDAWRRAHRREQ